MRISKQNLDNAVDAKIISKEQSLALSDFWTVKGSDSTRFNFTYILYYFGGFLAIGAMTIFMNNAWESFGGWGMFGLAIFYGIIALVLTEFLRNRDLLTPAAISATFMVLLIPLALYGLLSANNWFGESMTYHSYYNYIKWNWVILELGTLLGGAFASYRYRYPFLQLPIAFTLWFLSMDIVPLLFETTAYSMRSIVSLYFGILFIGLAFWVDIRSYKSKDYAFWLYIFGVMTFWGGLSLQHSHSEISKFFYLIINIVLMGFGAMIKRKVFVIFGALGIIGYLSHIAFDLFEDALLLPPVLIFLGAIIVYFGVLWQKHNNKITEALRSILPLHIRELLASRDEL